MGRRFFLGVGCQDPGERANLGRLSGVVHDLTRMRELFIALGYTLVELGSLGALNLDQTAEQLRTSFASWCERDRPGNDDELVFYYSGHGERHGQSLFLCLRGFSAAFPGATGFDASGLGRFIPERISRLWLIIDTCRSGDVMGPLGGALSEQMRDSPRAVWVLSASGGTPARDGAFSPALVSAAEELIASPEGCTSLEQIGKKITLLLGGRDRTQTPRAIYLDGNQGIVTFDFLRPSPGSAWFVAPPPSQPKPRSPRLPAWGYGTLGLLLSGATVFAWRTHGPAAPSVAFAAGSVQLFSDEQAARAAHASCVTRGECVGGFARERFANELQVAEVARVKPFRLDAYEVDARAFSEFVSAQLQRGSVAVHRADGRADTVRDAAGRDLARVRDEASADAITLVVDDVDMTVRALAGPLPATYVTWYGAEAYCRAHGGRLPTEAEWVLAAAGKESRVFPWGSEPPGACARFWYARQPDGLCAQPSPHAEDARRQTDDVTPEGVVNLGGNVREWTATLADPSEPGAFGCTAQRGVQGACKVVRGGSFSDTSLRLRTSTRAPMHEAEALDNVGFRCAYEGSKP